MMSTFSHFIHLVITIIFFPWLVVWILCAISANNSKRKRNERRKDEELALLREIARKK
jgi:hypothetical protein